MPTRQAFDHAEKVARQRRVARAEQPVDEGMHPAGEVKHLKGS
jgi:hypothetical protein